MEKKRYKLYIYGDYKVDLYNNGVLDESIIDDFELEKFINEQDKIIKELKKHNQDKISFAVEQLEKVKELCNNPLIQNVYVNIPGFRVSNFIDNQIKELKGVNYESNK